jgi:hypothetical protein
MSMVQRRSRTAIDELSEAQLRYELLLLTTALAWCAGLIHAVVSIEHFEEYFLFGLFFAVLAPLQVVWGVLAYRRPRRDVLLAGAAANLAVVALWIASRTVGLPIGPDAGHPEALGVVDVLCSADEVGLALLVVALLKLRDGTLGMSLRMLRGLGSGGAYVLMVGSLVALLLGAHHHGA